jgi:nickel-dependent lactate racemase
MAYLTWWSCPTRAFGFTRHTVSLAQEIDVQKFLLPMIGILTAALTCGCNSAKSPAAVAIDVAAARQQASTEVTDARKDAAKNVDSAAANVDGSSKDLNVASARAAYDVAVAQADGDHSVAIQQCSALTGEAQKSCKERADARDDQAKTHANVIRLSKIQ